MGQKHTTHVVDPKPSLNRSRKPSSNVSIALYQPTLSLSSFENLIHPLFVEICHHLSSSDALYVMPRLSQSINNRFDPVACCRGYLYVNLLDVGLELISPAHKRELLMLRRATRLSLYHCPGIATQEAIDNTIYALTSGSLESLYLVEHDFAQHRSITSPVLQHCASPSSRLRELYIQFETSSLFSDNTTFMQTWNGLKQCTQLKYLCVEVVNFFSVDLTCRELFESLPNSLEEFTLKSYIPSEHPLFVWKTMLCSTEFLPMLKKFYILEHMSYSDDIARVIATTIMSQTNKIRPISYWHVGASVHEIQTFPLRHLHFGSLSDEAEKLLLDCPSDLWPDLNSLNILIQPGSNDFAALSNLLALRHITELDIGIREDAESCFASEQTTFGYLPSLRFLRITIDNCRSERVGDLFLTNSLPNLEVLHLQCYHMSLQRLENILKAASNCRQVALGDDGQLSPTLMLAMTLHYCRSVALVDFTTDWIRREEHVEDVNRAFELYPIDSHHMQKLVRISLPLDQFCDSALHLLIHQLSKAPLLQAFHAYGGNSLLRMYLLISLPHVRNLPLDRHAGLSFIPEKQRDKLMNKFVKRLVIPSLSELEIRRRDSLFCQSEDFEQMMITSKTCNNRHTIVPVFQQETSHAGLTSGQQFASHIRQILSKSQQARLSSWDEADYSICTSRNSSEIRKLSRRSKGIMRIFRKKNNSDACQPLSISLSVVCAIP